MNEGTVILLLLGIIIIAALIVYKKAFTGTDAPKSETQTRRIRNITPEEAYSLIQKNKDNPDLVILDVRTPKEFADEYIENAINLDFHSETFKDDLSKIDKNKIYITHCRSGRRSAKTLDVMKKLGFEEAYNMAGGIDKWKEKGFPTAKQ